MTTLERELTENRSVMWLTKAEAALFEQFLQAVEDNDYYKACQWLNIMQRLQII